MVIIWGNYDAFNVSLLVELEVMLACVMGGRMDTCGNECRWNSGNAVYYGTLGFYW